jgi:predicted Zn-dependent protease
MLVGTIVAARVAGKPNSPALAAQPILCSHPTMKLFRMLSLIAAAAMLLLVTGCQTVPETGRRQFNFMSPQQEMQLGFSEFDKMKKQVPISRDPAANALVQKVGQRVAAVAQLPGAQWEFVVFESKEANAFCLPGGKVGVYTGILPITRDEAGLATVIGHEVAHAVARHGGERISMAVGLQTLGAAVGAAAQGSQYAAAITQIYGLGSQLGVALPHSRSQEAEADHIGLLYMARAGYDPEAAVAFWQRFAEFNRRAGGGQTPWFLRTHPLDEDRVNNLRRLMPRAKAEYRPQ